MINKNTMLGVTSFFLVLSLVLLSFSGINADLALDPIGGFMDMLSGNSQMSVLLALLGVVIFPLPFVLTAQVQMLSREPDYHYMVPYGLGVITILGLFGLSPITIAAATGLLVSGFFAISSSFTEHILYKKPMPSRVTSLAMRRAVYVISILLAFGVFYILFMNPSYGEMAMNEMVESMTGMRLEDLESQAKQMDDMSQNLAQAGVEATGVPQMGQALGMISMLAAVYPLMTAVTVFMTLSTLSFIPRMAGYLQSWAQWKILGREEPMENL